MSRRIIQVAGANAEFALADDGTLWRITHVGWALIERPPLPDSGTPNQLTTQEPPTYQAPNFPPLRRSGKKP